jgi:hypothetical protein
MSRPLPRAYFWIDQTLIRDGIWLKLKIPARLAYIALSASVDRQGVTIWSRSKLMSLAGSGDAEEFEESLNELQSQGLLVRLIDQTPAAIRLCALGDAAAGGSSGQGVEKAKAPTLPIHIHTHIQWGEPPRVDP